MTNAIQFIKDHGVDKAREVVEGAPDRATTVKPSLDFKHFMYGICENAAGAYILLSDLKRVVESVDTVKDHGGLETIKKCVEKTIFPLSDRIIRMKQAIADYESIGGEHV
ncbi:TPA: hypothetical protein ACVB54_001896 [Acinetobacter baumannii]